MGSSLCLTAEVGLVGVALAFGLTLLDIASAIRHISECHQSSDHGSTSGVFLPTRVMPYIVARVLGRTLGSSVLYVTAIGINTSEQFHFC